MPRTKRIVAERNAYHVISRGTNKQRVFFSSGDKRYFLGLIARFKEENGIQIFHYCLMNNHYHLLVWIAQSGDLARFMKQLNLGYFLYFRDKFKFCGHLWQDRYKSYLVGNDAYLLQCGKYIEYNPVRAGIVQQPQEYPYSSYRFYAVQKADRLVTPSPVYLSIDDLRARREFVYRQFIAPSLGGDGSGLDGGQNRPQISGKVT